MIGLVPTELQLPSLSRGHVGHLPVDLVLKQPAGGDGVAGPLDHTVQHICWQLSRSRWSSKTKSRSWTIPPPLPCHYYYHSDQPSSKHFKIISCLFATWRESQPTTQNNKQIYLSLLINSCISKPKVARMIEQAKIGSGYFWLSYELFVIRKKMKTYLKPSAKTPKIADS